MGQLFLYFSESKYIKQLISDGSFKLPKYYGFPRFIDELCSINNDNEFLTSLKNIYPKELEINFKHQVNHVLFVDLNIKIEGSAFIYKLFEKRDKFLFFLYRIPNLSRYIPSAISNGSIFSELLCIASCTIRINGFIPRTCNLFSRMRAQGGKRATLSKEIEKAFPHYPTVFQNSAKTQ